MQYKIEIWSDTDPANLASDMTKIVDASVMIPDSLVNTALEEGIAVVAAETAGFFHRGISAAVMAVNDAKSRPSSRLQQGVDLPLPQSVIDEIQRKTGLRVAGATIIDLGRDRRPDEAKAEPEHDPAAATPTVGPSGEDLAFEGPTRS